MNEIYDLDLFFTILTGKVSLQVNRALVRKFKVAGIEVTPEQFAVMAALWKQDGVTQQVLCDEMSKEKTGMTRLLDNLEKQNLVVRIADRNDRRNNLLHLTKKGRELEEVATMVAQETMKEALEGITIEQLETSRLTMRKVLENISK